MVVLYLKIKCLDKFGIRILRVGVDASNVTVEIPSSLGLELLNWDYLKYART